MSYQQKMIHHVAEAERYQAKAEALERIADDRADSGQLAAYLLTHDEVLAFPYKQATGNRNAHQQQAIMYGIAALVEAQDG